jgi:MFS family permease
VPVARGQVEYNTKRLYRAACVALAVVGLTFSIRGDIIGVLGAQFSLTNAQLGWIAGAAFWGYTACILVGGQLCETFGMGRLIMLACAVHVTGILLTIFAVGFWTLWIATLTIGVANALLEAAINPLIATIYSSQKTEKLNGAHAWFPWGIVAGAGAAFLLTQVGAGWRAKMALILAPTLVYGMLCAGQRFPVTERVQRGLRNATMYRETLRPGFLLWVFCMLLTASTELGPNQWIPDILSKTAHLPGILVLAWINGLMAVGRMLAGPVVRRFSPLGLLIAAAMTAAIGLFALSGASSGPSVFAAATVFALGVCYFWPTMLGVVSERFPASGAWGLALMGAAGNLSVALILPVIGKLYDLGGPHFALRYVVTLPVTLAVIFAVIRYTRRSSALAAAATQS